MTAAKLRLLAQRIIRGELPDGDFEQWACELLDLADALDHQECMLKEATRLGVPSTYPPADKEGMEAK